MYCLGFRLYFACFLFPGTPSSVIVDHVIITGAIGGGAKSDKIEDLNRAKEGCFSRFFAFPVLRPRFKSTALVRLDSNACYLQSIDCKVPFGEPFLLSNIFVFLLASLIKQQKLRLILLFSESKQTFFWHPPY